MVRPMMRYFFIALFCFSSLATSMSAQDIGGFRDEKQRFWVFEDGQFHQLHHQETPFFKTDGDFVLFTDSRDEFHYYSKGNEVTMHLFDANELYFTSNYLTVTTVANVLSVMREGKKETLSLQRDPFFVYGDSIVAFIDYDRILKVYEGNAINAMKNVKELENFEVNQVQASDNSVAYVNLAEEFYFYQKGEKELIEDDEPQEFKMGCDLILYIDNFGEFKIYRDGEFSSLISYEPLSYMVGDNVAAYLTDMGSFNWISSKTAEPVELSTEAPKFYRIVDNTMVYADDYGSFHVIYQDQHKTLTGYVPEEYDMSEGVVAYQDHNGYLRAFYEGEDVAVSEQIVTSFEVQGRVILFQEGNGSTIIFHNGQLYYRN